MLRTTAIQAGTWTFCFALSHRRQVFSILFQHTAGGGGGGAADVFLPLCEETSGFLRLWVFHIIFHLRSFNWNCWGIEYGTFW